MGGDYTDPSLTLPVPTRSWILVSMMEGKRGSCISGVTVGWRFEIGLCFIYLSCWGRTHFLLLFWGVFGRF